MGDTALKLLINLLLGGLDVLPEVGIKRRVVPKGNPLVEMIIQDVAQCFSVADLQGDSKDLVTEESVFLLTHYFKAKPKLEDCCASICLPWSFNSCQIPRKILDDRADLLVKGFLLDHLSIGAYRVTRGGREVITRFESALDKYRSLDGVRRLYFFKQSGLLDIFSGGYSLRKHSVKE